MEKRVVYVPTAISVKEIKKLESEGIYWSGLYQTEPKDVLKYANINRHGAVGILLYDNAYVFIDNINRYNNYEEIPYNKAISVGISRLAKGEEL